VNSMNILRQLRRRFFPSEQQLMARKWRADGGDNAMRFNYDLDESSVVLDLGGYEGQWASDLFARYRCSIYIFEPVKSFAARIRERFSRNDRLQVFTCGLGATTRSDEIYLAADGSSKFVSAGNREVMEIVDAKDWIGMHFGENPRIDLVKLNIEGGEYELLERLIETGLIANIRDIQVQFHDIAPDSPARMQRIQAALMKTHEPTYQYRFVWENWTRRKHA
jgi:FkbM family methyltransferase